MQAANSLKSALLSIVSTLLLCTALVPAIAGPDLDVSYIQRTPHYNRYNVTYTDNINPYDGGTSVPSLSTSEQNLQRWPKAGETVTFKAVVRNPGSTATGSFGYKWYFDGVEVASGTLSSIAPGGETSTTYQWKWDSEQNTHMIKFIADPNNQIAEEIETNNSIEDPTNALYFSFYVWQGLYDWFKVEARKTNPNIASFDDWAQLQMYHMNRMFREAVYPHSPNGILERVRLDQIVIYPESKPDQEPGATHAPIDWWADGRRGFMTTEYQPIFESDLSVLNSYMPSCIHELGHQLGLMDLYRLNIEIGENCNSIQPSIGQTNTRAGELMNSCGPYLSDHTAYAMNAALHKRRGFYGEFLYDLPQTCRVRVVDAYYRPLPNAALSFYQDTGRYISSPATFAGTADSAGYFTLPNRTSYRHFTTVTGHTLHDNPWGLINVVGFNALMFCNITTGSQTDYQFLELLPFNVAYRAGYMDDYTYDLQTNIVPEGRPTTSNLNSVKMSSATNGYAVGDGGVILQWNGTAWTSVTSPTTVKLNAVDIDTTSGNASAVGDNGTVIFKSGSGWVKKTFPKTTSLKTCAMVTSTTIVVGGDSGVLYRSTNSGSNWSAISATTNNILSIDFADSTHGLMLTYGSRAYYSTNGGSSWTQANNDLDYWWTASNCCMASATEAYVCTQNGDIIRSTDGGKNWTTTNTGPGRFYPMMSIDMAPGGNGWAVSSCNSIIGAGVAQRIENLKPFRQTMQVNAGDFNDISCINGIDAWAVGKNGLIMHLVANNVDNYTTGNTSQTLSKPNGTQVVATDCKVTASFPGNVYVESNDRNAGFKVLTNQTFTPGTLVQVSGILDTDGFERVLKYGDILRVGSGDIKPLGLNAKALTGSTADKGLKTIPLLVRIFGTVKARNEAAGWFTVDDGSGKKDASGNPGVKVVISGVTPPQIGTFVVVTGISSFETVSSKTYPLIKARGQSDIQ